METVSDKPAETKRSEKQREASRRNGSLSHGPVTEKGKRRSSRNSLRHSLFAKSIVMQNERQQNFMNLARQYRKRLGPRDPVELGFIEDMTAAVWQLRRLYGILTSKLDAGLPDSQSALPDIMAGAPREMDRTSTSFFELATNPGFHTFLRYQGDLFRKCDRVVISLQKIREIPFPEDGIKKPGNEPGDAGSEAADISNKVK